MTKKRKKSKGVIPKKIAGVKVPKSVRKGRFGELLASRAGQAVIAQAILGAGAIAAGVKARENPKVRGAAQEAKHKLAEAGDTAAHDARAVGSTLAYALGEAARSFANALQDGQHRRGAPAGDDEPAWAPDYGAPQASSTATAR